MRYGALAAVVAVFVFGWGPQKARAERVVVFPLDARALPYQTAMAATDALLKSLKRSRGVEVIDPATVESRLKVNLTQQARECEYDVFCLVEVGEILQGERILIGHVKRRGGSEAEPKEIELKLVVLDVIKANMKEILIWRVKPNTKRAVSEAASTAVRRLFTPPRAKVTFELDPPDAKMFFYEDVVGHEPGAAMSLWPGVYQVRLEAPEYHPKETRVVVKKGKSTIKIELESNPLYVAEPVSSKANQPFERSSRRIGSGISAQQAGAALDTETEAFIEHPWPLVAVGLGVAAAAGGGVLMGVAQSGYNDLAQEERYTTAQPAETAVRLREDQRGRYQMGSALVFTGVGVAIGGLIWWLIESSGDDDAPQRRVTQTRTLNPDPARRRAARWMAREVFK